ncbi:helix-turn-helix domain-containing protein [Photobacterium sp. MCCC 1A19761]|uniref:GlxA family transcriptional regulator n=1 Tax=Photobacterium sp. MCCC 1A19761 TaxID=3115000 RepID=UPI00307EB11F
MITQHEPLRITVLMSEGMPTTAISGPVEMLTVASSLAGLPHPEVNFVSPTGGAVQALGGLTLSCNQDWRTVEHCDILLLGACGDPGQHTFMLSHEMNLWLKKLIRRSSFVYSLCTGAFLLAELGLLNKKGATTHWVYAEMFRHRYPKVRLMPQLNITHDAPYICTSSVKDYFAATMMIIDTLFGAAHREKCEQYLGGEISTIQQVCQTSFSQFRQHRDDLIHSLQDWMHREDPAKLSVSRCAEKSYLSERQMKRRFKAATGETPVNYIQRIRVVFARDKLDTSSLNVDQISQQVGYSDTNHFRLLFKKFHGMTPTQYRKTTQVYTEFEA